MQTYIILLVILPNELKCVCSVPGIETSVHSLNTRIGYRLRYSLRNQCNHSPVIFKHMNLNTQCSYSTFFDCCMKFLFILEIISLLFYDIFI